MKVIFRLKAALAHPSWIAHCFKDKILIPIIFVLVFAGIYGGVSAGMIYSSTYITRDDSVTVSEKLTLNSLKNTTIEYSNYKMSGTKAVVNYDNTFKIYFNVDPNQEVPNSQYFNLYFLEDGVKGYTGSSTTFNASYSDLKYDFSFTLAQIVEGNNKARITFVDFLDTYLTMFEQSYENQVMIGSAATFLQFFGFLLLIMFIFTYLLNPTIKFGVRSKLMLYDTISFIFLFTLSVVFNSKVLEYIAVVISIFYSNITFRHIIRKGEQK